MGKGKDLRAYLITWMGLLWMTGSAGIRLSNVRCWSSRSPPCYSLQHRVNSGGPIISITISSIQMPMHMFLLDVLFRQIFCMHNTAVAQHAGASLVVLCGSRDSGGEILEGSKDGWCVHMMHFDL